MLSSGEWQQRTVDEGLVRCPACDSGNVSMGACGVGAFTVYQEYVCESCAYEFQAVFALAGFSGSSVGGH